MRKVRCLSHQSASVLALFVSEPKRELHGLEILRTTALRSGSLYPILHRLEEQEYLVSRWETLDDAVAGGRRPRRLYRLDPEGAHRARAALRESDPSHAPRPATTPSAGFA
jgi:DNA-binding PadR family transcriptional regulator